MLQIFKFSWRDLWKKFKNEKTEILQLLSTDSIDYAGRYSRIQPSKAK